MGVRTLCSAGWSDLEGLPQKRDGKAGNAAGVKLAASASPLDDALRRSFEPYLKARPPGPSEPTPSRRAVPIAPIPVRSHAKNGLPGGVHYSERNRRNPRGAFQTSPPEGDRRTLVAERLCLLACIEELKRTRTRHCLQRKQASAMPRPAGTLDALTTRTHHAAWRNRAVASGLDRVRCACESATRAIQNSPQGRDKCHATTFC